MSFIATTDMYIEMRNKRDLAEDKYHDMKKERDTLIDDLKVLREKNEKLKEEMKRLKRESNITVFCALEEENEQLKQDNKALRLQANTYFDEWQNVKKLYTTLTDHIRLKASANPGEHRYIALVNFIDRLERGEDGD